MRLVHLRAVVLLAEGRVVTGLRLEEDYDDYCEAEVDQEEDQLEVI